MVKSGFSDFSVYDDQHTYRQIEYGQSRIKSAIISAEVVTGRSKSSDNGENATIHNGYGEHQIPTEDKSIQLVYIDGSCILKTGQHPLRRVTYFGGHQGPWNCSLPHSSNVSPTNNKAELSAAIKAIQIAVENKLKDLGPELELSRLLRT